MTTGRISFGNIIKQQVKGLPVCHSTKCHPKNNTGGTVLQQDDTYQNAIARIKFTKWINIHQDDIKLFC
jgi:hypothetical protein